MDASKRMVNLFFAASTLLAWVIMAKLFALIFATAGVRDAHILGKQFTSTTLLAAFGAVSLLVYTWRHERARPLVNEVADELVKVTWPTWEETKNNSKVTVVVTLIIALILWLFDQVFGNLTSMLLGG
ncbi:MAG: preprotein translocase subunit SecE [Myxococcales bacterium]|jgi:preprotein translocase subunit SecE|nr:preprotein translocase subunit SecE [Myxococcales bacterium]